MCKQPIMYNLSLGRRLKTCEEFKRATKNKVVMFVATVLMMLIIFGLVGFISWFSVSRELSFSGDEIIEPVIIIVACVIVLIFFCVGLYFLIDEFVLAHKVSIEVVKTGQVSRISMMYLNRGKSNDIQVEDLE